MASALARTLRNQQPKSANDGLSIAQTVQFGCEDCLIVMDEDSVAPSDEGLTPLYRSTFENPAFNPRWKQGTANYIEVVDL